jgi:hypothetical protein
LFDLFRGIFSKYQKGQEADNAQNRDNNNIQGQPLAIGEVKCNVDAVLFNEQHK